MNIAKLASCAVFGGVLFQSLAADAAIELGFAGEELSVIKFDPGGTFSFTDEVPNNFNDFAIVNSTGTGDAVGKFGDLDGIFTIGPITLNPVAQTAPVTGNGVLRINDGAGFIFQADVSLLSIVTVSNVGGLNMDGTLNLSGVSYGGSLSDLTAFSNGGTLQASFVANTGTTLTSLKAIGSRVDDYSGTLRSNDTVVPEPASIVCWSMLAAVGIVAAVHGRSVSARAA